MTMPMGGATAPAAEGLRIALASRGPEGSGALRVLEVQGGDLVERGQARRADLRGLASHPRLPIVYGITGGPGPASLVAWCCDADTPLVIGERGLAAEESEPCHIAVAPSGSYLVVALYETGALEVWRLRADGALAERADAVVLDGRSVDPDRQEAAHPHQVLFPAASDGREFLVADLGGDRIHRFEVESEGSGVRTLAASSVPAGTGPRHMVELPDGRIAATGELAATLLLGSLGPDSWIAVPSTSRSGPARSRSARNYPGDIAISPEGTRVYVANRGYDTIAVFDVSEAEPRLVAEVETASWPQHLYVASDHVLVACQDDSALVRLATSAIGLDAVGIETAVPSPTWISAIAPF